MPILLSWVATALALLIGDKLMSGVFVGGLVPALIAAAVLGLVNVTVKPILFILTLPINLLTLGLFTFVINALMLMLTSSLSDTLGLGFHVAGFWAAFWGALVVTLVSWVLSMALKDTSTGT